MTTPPRIYEVIAPSNIALIKYWGKRDERRQWPANDSLSMTLCAAHTITRAWLINTTSSEQAADQIVLNGVTLTRANADRQLKLFQQLDLLREEIGLDGALCVETVNSFPTGCGIASSASGFAALTMAVAAALTQAESEADMQVQGLTRARLAHLARLGSGSAGRSLFGGYVEWSAGSYAETQRVAALFDAAYFPLADVICIVSNAEKNVSSTTAHRAAWSSPLFRPRLAGLKDRLDAVKLALQQRDLDALGPLIEAEALEMHAVIMSATPAVTYLTTQSSQLLAWVREQRRRGDLPAYFTIDAGPNVHLLCLPRDVARVAARVQQAFPEINVLLDKTGDGPEFSSFAATAPYTRQTGSSPTAQEAF